jgi:hypothetical protein
MVVKLCTLLGLLAFAAASAKPVKYTPTAEDLARAARRPLPAFQGNTFEAMNDVLNEHLTKSVLQGSGGSVISCSSLSVAAAADIHRLVFAARSPSLDEFYITSDDPRALPLTSEAQLEQAIVDGQAAINKAPELTAMVRDTHCRLAVMTFVHHLAAEARAELLHMTSLPTLPSQDHSRHKETTEASTLLQQAIGLHESANACGECHFNTGTKPPPPAKKLSPCVKGLEAAPCFYYPSSSGASPECVRCATKAVSDHKATCKESEIAAYCSSAPETRPMADNLNYTIYSGPTGCCAPGEHNWTQKRTIDRRYDLKQQLEVNTVCNQTGFADGACCMLDSCVGKPTDKSVQYQGCHLFYNGTTIWEY